MADWRELLRCAVSAYLEQEVTDNILEHTVGTPARVVSAWEEFVSGYRAVPTIEQILSRSFEDSSGYEQMIHVRDIPIVSVCSHHILPIVGTAHFAYVPNGRVVGLSKIPRFIDVLARRLQVQEALTQSIVMEFMKNVSCNGCAVTIVARHACMEVRGVRVPALMETTALRGVFFDNQSTRAEFLK